jgi:hypothetical protein
MNKSGGNSGMGMSKHGKHGVKNGSGKSPKMRHTMKREAEKQEKKAKPSTCKYKSVQDAMNKERI